VVLFTQIWHQGTVQPEMPRFLGQIVLPISPKPEKAGYTSTGERFNIFLLMEKQLQSWQAWVTF